MLLRNNITNLDLYVKYAYMYLFHCSFTVFFYFHDYISQMLHGLTEKQIYREVLHEKLHDLQSLCWSRNLRLLCNPQFTDVETACHRFLSSAKQIRSVPVIYLTSTWKLSSNLRLSIPSSLYPSSLLTANFFVFASSVTCTAHAMFLDFISQYLLMNSSWTTFTNAQLFFILPLKYLIFIL